MRNRLSHWMSYVEQPNRAHALTYTLTHTHTHAHTHTLALTESDMLLFPLHQCSSFRRRAHFIHHLTTDTHVCRHRLHVFGMWNTFAIVSIAPFLPNTNWYNYKIQWKVFMYLHPFPLPRVDFRATDVENCSPSLSLTAWLH
jgi:hypothetical protein